MYRGLHCPICATYRNEFERARPSLKKGVITIAVSADSAEGLHEMAKWILANMLQIGYNLSLKNLRDCGLYVSTFFVFFASLIQS